MKKISDLMVTMAIITPIVFGIVTGSAVFSSAQELKVNIPAAIPYKSTDSFYKGIEQVSRHLLKYIFMDQSSDECKSSVFNLQSRVDTTREHLKKFDMNLSFNVGYDENSTLGVHAVKVSSYLCDTHLNAVYYHKDSQIDLFFSNAGINSHLMEGMKLEFQVSPQKEEGVVFITMEF